ncbi:MAG: hypothetical protein JNM47_03410 [Hyphomonadaceae bacterium]|nr:hypothetical protein [Hyphomonadaceae bacterium]
MSTSWDEEYRGRRMRRRGSRLMLREPVLAYATAGLAILYAVALMVGMSLLALLLGIEMTAASGLSAPVATATAATALFVGGRLQRYEIKTRGAFLVQVAIVWAVVGAAWPMIPAFSGFMGESIDLGGSQAILMGAGALIAASSGVAGAAAAMALCIEGGRRR